MRRRLLRFLTTLRTSPKTHYSHCNPNNTHCSYATTLQIHSLSSTNQNPYSYCKTPQQQSLAQTKANPPCIQNKEEANIDDEEFSEEFKMELNKVCQTLSNNRSPHHPLEAALELHKLHVTTELVSQGMKRCCNLWYPTYRFFLWAVTQEGFAHTTKTCEIMIDILGRFEQFDLVWQVLNLMKSREIDVTSCTFYVIFKRSTGTCHADVAIKAFKCMELFGCKAGLEDLGHLVYGLQRNKLTEALHSFYQEIKTQYRPSAQVYGFMIKSYGESDNLDKAWEIFKEMAANKQLDNALEAYNAMLAVLCKQDLLDEMYKLYHEMMADGPKPDGSTYSVLILALCEAKKLEVAVRTLIRSDRYGFTPSVTAYNAIIEQLCTSQDTLEEARQIMDSMLSKDVLPDFRTYSHLICSHCQFQQLRIASKLFDKMLEDEIPVSHKLYNMLIRASIRELKFERALYYWEDIEAKGLVKNVSNYCAMIHELLKLGWTHEAVHFFNEMIKKAIPPYVYTCKFMMQCLVKLDDQNAMYIFHDRMKRSMSSDIQDRSRYFVPARDRRFRPTPSKLL